MKKIVLTLAIVFTSTLLFAQSNNEALVLNTSTTNASSNTIAPGTDTKSVNYTYAITNSAGKIIKSGIHNSDSKYIDLSELPNGIYDIRLSQNERWISTRKIEIARE